MVEGVRVTIIVVILLIVIVIAAAAAARILNSTILAVGRARICHLQLESHRIFLGLTPALLALLSARPSAVQKRSSPLYTALKDAALLSSKQKFKR